MADFFNRQLSFRTVYLNVFADISDIPLKGFYILLGRLTKLINIPLGCEICDRCLLAFFDDRHNNFSLRSGEAYRLKAV